MIIFKKGDRFIPHKPKDTDPHFEHWIEPMDLYDGRTLIVDRITKGGNLCVGGIGLLFNPDWCEKVGDSEIPNNHIPDVGKTIDWEQRRCELAKSAMQGLLANPERYKYISEKVLSGELSQKEATYKNIRKAIYFADEMIKQLKGE